MKNLKSIKLSCIRRILLLFLLLFVVIARLFSGVAEFYARDIYPLLSGLLIRAASIVPFSLTEITVVVFVLCILAYPVCTLLKKGRHAWKHVLVCEVEMLLWFYVWFYWGWGINYFRYDFYRRSETHFASFDKDEFVGFLSEYTDSLNAAYRDCFTVSISEAAIEVKNTYSKLPMKWGLLKPIAAINPKKLMVNPLYSKVGVMGYIGPFYAEMHLNHQLLPEQYPFTYAHELSHVLGVSSEAEANFWAYTICTHSANDNIRYSGYMGILSYVIGNARQVLDREEYTSWLNSIDERILREYSSYVKYWRALYSPMIGEIQNVLYDWFLKGNQIHSGIKNYSQVVRMIISCRKTDFGLQPEG